MALCGAAPNSPPGTWPTRRRKERAARRLRLLQRVASWPQAHFELWYADATRFELLPVVSSMWRLRGARLWVPTPGKNLRVAVCGAIRFPTREFLFTHQLKSINTALLLPLLEQLVHRAQRTGRPIVLVHDNGVPFNSLLAQATLEAAIPYVRSFPLPRYTSETLNWIENFWDHLKQTYFSRMLTYEREAFYPDTIRLLQRLHRSGRLDPLALRTP
jgi:DDE superfamily endonuclease